MSKPLGSRYRIGALIGHGGMGKVFRGHDDQGRPFAIKVLRPELSSDPDLVLRFVRERNVLLRVRGPHVVPVHDLVVEGDTLAIVMELVPGADLRAALRSGSFAPAEVARIGAGIARGLAVAHEAGVVHRDVKPENVLLDESVQPPIVRVTDFGISRMANATTTSTGTALIGSPHYLAPELWSGASPTPQSDLYALGIVLYELSCGVPPFTGDPFAVMEGHREHLPGRPPGVPDPLWEGIELLLSRAAGDRPPRAQPVAERLTALSELLIGLPAASRQRVPPAPIWSPPAAVTAPFALPPTTHAGELDSGGQGAADRAPGSSSRRWRSPTALLLTAVLLGAAGAWAATSTEVFERDGLSAVPAPSSSASDTTASTQLAADSTASASPQPSLTPGGSPPPSRTGTPVCLPFRGSPEATGTSLDRDSPGDPCRDAIKMVQVALKIFVDGVFGPQTLAKVREHQLSRCPNFALPGVIGPWTWDTTVGGQDLPCPSGPSETALPIPTSTPAPTDTVSASPSPGPGVASNGASPDAG